MYFSIEITHTLDFFPMNLKLSKFNLVLDVKLHSQDYK